MECRNSFTARFNRYFCPFLLFVGILLSAGSVSLARAFQGAPGISVSVSASPTIIAAGQTVSYTIVATNVGGVDLNLTLNDDVWGPVVAGVALPIGRSVTYVITARPIQSVTNTVTATGQYSSSGDTGPARVTATAAASVSVLPSTPSMGSVAFVHGPDLTAASSYQALLQAGGYSVTLVPMSRVSTVNMSVFNLILVASDTGSSYTWGDAASVSVIRDAGKPIVGLGYGGACLFEQLSLSINWGNGWIGPLGQMYVVDLTHPVFNSPNLITVPVSRILQLYSSSDHIGEYAGYISPAVRLLGREPDDPVHYPLVEEGHNVLWGYTASPADMSDDGKRLFLNVAAYAAGLTAQVLPDLIVTDFWREGNLISYQVRNVGQAPAPRGSVTSLKVDGTVVSTDTVNVDLAPGERLTRNFGYNWISQALSNTLAVTVDSLGALAEADETNNAREAVWKFDTVPPRILSGPQISGITQNSAIITWQTDEDSDGMARYGMTAGRSLLEKSEGFVRKDHRIMLTDLAAAATYRFVVRSADPSGNTTESREAWFQTPARTGATPPTVSIPAPGVLSGIARLTAAVTESSGNARVEFFIDGNLAFTAYGPPYEFVADTATLANGDHTVRLNAVNSAGLSSTYETAFKVMNPARFAPKVKILSPANGETVSGNTAINVEVTSDHGLNSLTFSVDDWMLGGKSIPLPYPTAGVFQLTLDTQQVKGGNGKHYLKVTAWDESGRTGDSGVEINVLNMPPPDPPKLTVTGHRVTRKGNYFTIEVTVANVGGDTATDIVLKDILNLFQPILNSSPYADFSTEPGYSGVVQKIIIRAKDVLAAGWSAVYSFDAVPVLPYPGGPVPMIGNGELELSWKSPRQTWTSSSSLSFPVTETTGGEPIIQAHESATKVSDYLIVTSPDNLLSYNSQPDVSALLSKMAELAKLKNGTLGYLDSVSSLPMSFRPGDSLASGNVAGDGKAELILGDQMEGKIHVYGLQIALPFYNAWGPAPPVAWRELASFKCGAAGSFTAGDRLAVGNVLGRPERQIIVAHGTGRIDLCANVNPSVPSLFGPAIGAPPSGGFVADFQAHDGLAAGDINGDGIDEIVVAHAASDTIIIYSGSGAQLRKIPFGYTAGDGLAVGDVLGLGRKQIIIARVNDPNAYVLSDTGDTLDTFLYQLHAGDALAAGRVIESWTDNQDQIVFADALWDRIHIWRKTASGWGGIKWFPRPIEPGYGLALGHIFGDQGLDIIVADTTENSIDFHCAGDAGGGKHPLRDLIQASTGAWSAKLKSDWTSNGYLLIVGEPEIVPAWGGKTFGKVITTAGETELRADVTDYPYASTAGEQLYPELAIGRIIGDTAKQLMVPLQTSIEVARKTPGFGFSGSTSFCVSGFPGLPPNNIDFKTEAFKTALTLKNKGIDGLAMFNQDYGVYDAAGKFDKAATDAIVVPKFFANIPNNDIVFLAGHGGPQNWDAIAAGDVLARNKPFGSVNPFVFASSCETGMYFRTNSVAQAFLQRGAGVYLGATNYGLGLHSAVSPYLFNIWKPGEAVGQLAKRVKQNLLSTLGFTLPFQMTPEKYWAGIYHVLGDPKYGANSSYLQPSAAPMSSISTGETSTAITVPDYVVTRIDGMDTVTIGEGRVLSIPGMPEVPSYRVSFSIPKNLQVQDVTLQSRSAPVSGTGFNLPLASPGVVGHTDVHPDLLLRTGLGDWWPRVPFVWTVIEGPDSDTLVITLYPFDYNPLTTDVRFYKTYTLNISSILSSAGVTGLAVEKDSYKSGEPVKILAYLENGGAGSTDAVVRATIREEGSGEIAGGLTLGTLRNLRGKASYSGTWDSTGAAPGYYVAYVELIDSQGLRLARKSVTFRLESASGEITSFSATPQVFMPGDAVALSITFRNTGSQYLSGQAVVKILSASRDVIAIFSHDITGLAPAASVRLDDQWNTAQVAPGVYVVTGAVIYDGIAARAGDLTLVSNTPYADAGPDQTVERNAPGGARVTLNGSKSFSPAERPLAFAWTWAGGSASGVTPTVLLPMGDTTVTLTVSDGTGSASDNLTIRVVDTTPAAIRITLPAQGDALQDGTKFSAEASDLSGVTSVYFWIRTPSGMKGNSLGLDAVRALLKSGTAESGSWELSFNSTRLPDGFYVVLAKAVDAFGNEAWSQSVPFSIRNWSVLQLLPSTASVNAGRTMPIKFALRIAAAVDPTQPYVRNQELTITIAGGGQVLQTSTYGLKSTDYRIDDSGRLYITNFQSQKTPMQYTVEVLRKGMSIGSFTFATIK